MRERDGLLKKGPEMHLFQKNLVLAYRNWLPKVEVGRRDQRQRNPGGPKMQWAGTDGQTECVSVGSKTERSGIPRQ